MTVYEIPAARWVKFRCTGPMPGAVQATNTRIFKEWLPGNPEYEIASETYLEWYSPEGNSGDANYESGIWIPVNSKNSREYISCRE